MYLRNNHAMRIDIFTLTYYHYHCYTLSLVLSTMRYLMIITLYSYSTLCVALTDQRKPQGQLIQKCMPGLITYMYTYILHSPGIHYTLQLYPTFHDQGYIKCIAIRYILLIRYICVCVVRGDILSFAIIKLVTNDNSYIFWLSQRKWDYQSILILKQLKHIWNKQYSELFYSLIFQCKWHASMCMRTRIFSFPYCGFPEEGNHKVNSIRLCSPGM